MIQLKATSSFIELLSSVKRVEAVVLCEGSTDAEAFKALANKLGLAEGLKSVAVTDAEGVNTLRGAVLPGLLALIVGKVVSRPKPIAVIVDADDLKPEERTGGLLDVLRSRGFKSASLEQACENTWRVDLEGETSTRIPLIITVNGVFREQFGHFEVHELEDHLVYLKLLEGRIDAGALRSARRAKELVAVDDFELLHSADARHVREAFAHMSCLLNVLRQHLGVNRA